MVEILLNFFWLAIAMSIAIGTTLCPRLRGRRGTAIAGACLVAILFPIISITDDLSPAREAIEEAKPARRSSVVSAWLADGSSPAVHASIFPATLPAVPRLLALTAEGIVSCSEARRRTLLVAAAAAPRSPPVG